MFNDVEWLNQVREKRKRSKHFGKWVNRLVIWRDERLDRHVNQAKHMVSGFNPRINIYGFAIGAGI